jgi:hypothetical protein
MNCTSERTLVDLLQVLVAGVVGHGVPDPQDGLVGGWCANIDESRGGGSPKAIRGIAAG